LRTRPTGGEVARAAVHKVDLVMSVDEVQVSPVGATDSDVRGLIDALTAELAGSGYTPEQTFGYSAERLDQAGVHLVGAHVAHELAGIAGVEVEGDGFAELKRFYVLPVRRGTGVADALLDALTAYAADRGVRTLRLETGDRQHAAMRFYARHGFRVVPRFGPYVESATSVCMQRDL
jgi:putative acetyltransferase